MLEYTNLFVNVPLYFRSALKAKFSISEFISTIATFGM